MDITNTDEHNNERNSLLPKAKMIRSKTDFFLIVALQGLYLASFGMYSVIGPFYMLKAKEKGTTATVSGLVFAAYAFVIFVLSPVAGKNLPKLGPVRVLLVGSLVEGLGEILFGFVVFFQEQWTFALFSFLLRIVTAVGAAFSQTALISILCVLYPDHVSVSFGMLELASGVGLMIGPSLGGLLYHIGGFMLPFIALGLFSWLMLGIAMITLPRHGVHTETKDEPTTSLWRVAKVPGVTIIGMCTVIGGFCVSFYHSTTAVQLDDIAKGKFSKAKIGAFFLCSSGLYAVSAPLWGYLVEHKMQGKYAMIIGHILAIIAFAVMGPAPFLQPVLTATPASAAISLSLAGLSMAPLFVPAIGTMQQFAVDSGLKNDLSLNSLISGLFSSCYYIGNFLGPIFGGFVLQYTTFSWGCFILISLLFSGGTALTVLVLCNAYRRDKKHHSSKNDGSKYYFDNDRFITNEAL